MQEKPKERTITGSTPKPKEDSQYPIRKGKEEPISFTIDFNLDSDYEISGCAHFEDVDRENEVIAIKAIKSALPDFMQHPILHYQHTERPIGTITEAIIDGKGLYIKAKIYDTKDTADAWEEIKTGKLNAYSIYGKRTISSPECKLAPEQRISPCRTDGLHLWSVSAVGKSAGTHEVNEHTFLDVVKALTDYYKNEHILIKAETTDSKLIHTTTDGSKEGGKKEMPFAGYKDFAACERSNSGKGDPGAYCATIEHQATGEWPGAKKGESMEKGDAIEHYTENQEGLHGNPLEDEGRGESVLKSEEGNKSSILERLSKIETVMKEMVAKDKEVHDSMKKGEGEIDHNKDLLDNSNESPKADGGLDKTVESAQATENLTGSEKSPKVAKASEEDEDGKREPEKVEKCSEMKAKKGEKESKMEDKEEGKEEVQKAVMVDEEIITKAQFGAFTKAFTDELLNLKARVEKMEDETIQKGGQVVVISEQAEVLSASERNAKVFGVI